MKRVSLLILWLLITIFLTGCMKTYTYQAERKDQAISGNRGVVMGETPEPEVDRKATRTMLGIDVELPPSKDYKAQKRGSGEREVPFREEIEEVTEETAIRLEPKKEIKESITRKKEVKKELPLKEMTYTIQKGDTLEKIAKRFLGKSSRWPEIYEFNKDVLKSPSRIYPGQVIKIPPETIEEDIEGPESEYK
jgi:nucleoid-associated protein YgaU